MEGIKKIQTEEILETETQGREQEPKMQHHQQNIRDGRENSDVEDTIEEIDISVKENVKSRKIADTNHPRNLGYYEKI